MNETHADDLFRTLLAGHALTESDRAHADRCASCRKSIADFEEFEARLGRVAENLATEPLPEGILDPGLSRRPLLSGVVMPAIAAVLAISAVIALTRFSLVPPVGVASPSPEPSGDSEMSPPSWTPRPEATTPPDSVSRGDFVEGPYGCGDGVGGFVIWILDGWYANSAHDGIPACRLVSMQQFAATDAGNLPPVPITLSVQTGDYEPGGEVIERSELSLEELPALRFVVAAENGRRLVYVVGLEVTLPSEGNPDRYLVAMTMFGDATFERDRDALDQMVERFVLAQDPYVHDAAAVAQADSLFAETLTCRNAELGFEVDYPATWFTNPAAPESPACTWFGPSEVPSADPSTRPDSAVIGMRVYSGGVGVNSSSFLYETRNVGGLPARLTEGFGGVPWDPDPTLHTYDYLVEFGDHLASGPNLVATTDTSVSFDYDVAKEVLDRMMASLTLVDR
ncbi:MAG TPA: hypothetical protein VES62_07705 [Thermoleophilaceae bacterium]|nr:hypothetical protein [Thermoleophilaceae bacterium]